MPVGQGLHEHVVQPFASVLFPYGHACKQAIGRQPPWQLGGDQTHWPAVLRAQDAGMIIPPEHIGCAYGGGEGHSADVQGAGAGLQAHVGHPLASVTFPY